MGVREKLNENPVIGIAITAAAVVVLGLVLYWQFSGGSVPRPATLAFYTDDEGASFFTDDINKIVPYQRDGKTVYRAEVYECDDGERFVAFIGRHTPLGRQEMQEYLADPADPYLRGEIESRGMEIRRVGPGEGRWILKDPVVGDTVLGSVQCPSGEPARPVSP